MLAAADGRARTHGGAPILTLDRVREWAAVFGVGRGNDLDLLQQLYWPDLLGLLCSASIFFTGFKGNSGEYKVMRLAPYGEPKYVDVIYRELVDLRVDDSFTLNQKYFKYLPGLTMTNDEFAELFSGRAACPSPSLQNVDEYRQVQPGGVRGDHAAYGPDRPLGDRDGPPVPGRRGGAQLRRQRTHPAGSPVQAPQDPTCRR